MSLATNEALKPEVSKPSEVYEAIVESLSVALANSATEIAVAGYEDWSAVAAKQLQVLVEFAEADGGEWQQDGRQSQVFEVVLYAVVSKGIPRAASAAMDLASQLLRFVDRKRWGFHGRAVGYPERLKSEVSFLVEKGDGHSGYEAWEVRWRQELKFGKPQLGAGGDAFDPPVAEINFSLDPAAEEQGFESVGVGDDA